MIIARVLELQHQNLQNILSKEDMISMMWKHMAKYVNIWNIFLWTHHRFSSHFFYITSSLCGCNKLRCLGMLVSRKSLQKIALDRFAWTYDFIICASIYAAFSILIQNHVFSPSFVFVLQFIQVLQRELDVLEKEKDEFISDFSEVSFLFPVICHAALINVSLCIIFFWSLNNM